MTRKLTFLNLLWMALLVSFAAPAADRAIVDGKGVLRWKDGREVAVMGVNYYAPFWEDYHLLKTRGVDFKRTIDDDIQHFRRLGLDCLRLHAIDREFSTPEGDLVANDHLDKLDYLLAAAISNGLHVVLTPVAWFSGPRDGEPKGFSQVHTKEQLCSEPGPERVVCRFLKAFVSHVNSYTGVRYADEPGILAFECFNEPRYAKGFSDEQLTAHVTRLADAIRSTGTTKPVLYSIWQGRSAAIAAGRIDGVTISAYPNDIQHGRETDLPKLERVRLNEAATNSAVASKLKIAYEFDSADSCCSFMLPAISRMFRSVGVQAAAMFQYDELPLASENAATRTHYLNLVYTPGKAIGLAIAAEVFRRVPRQTPFEPATDAMVFPPFRIDRTRDCAELAAADRYCYTNGALTPPPDPSRLEHVWGVGASSVVTSEGTGAYFLDREAPGRWRLQLYPDVFRLADPFTGRKGEKVAALDRPVALTVNLPDLGPSFRLVLTPGDYVVSRGGKVEPAPADGRAPRFVLPPTMVSTPVISPAVPRQMCADRETVVPCPTAFADSAELVFARGSDEKRRFPVRDGVCRVPAGALAAGRWNLCAVARGSKDVCVRPWKDEKSWSVNVLANAADWNLFDAESCANAWLFGSRRLWPTIGRDVDGAATYRLHFGTFTNDFTSFTLRLPLTGADRRRTFPASPCPTTVVVRMRAITPVTDRIEFVVYDAQGRPWGKVIRLSAAWQDIRVATTDLTYFKHWKADAPSPAEGERLDARELTYCAFTLGRWLNKETPPRPHEIEISSIRAD